MRADVFSSHPPLTGLPSTSSLYGNYIQTNHPGPNSSSHFCSTAAANSLNALMRMLGTSSCSAVAAAVVTAMTQEVGGRTLPSASAYTVVFLAAAGAALLATLITAATPRRTARNAPVAEVYAAR